jgi:hypothetical protein
MTLRTRIWTSVVVVAVLLVVGEWFGRRNRQGFRRAVEEKPAPALQRGQVLVTVKGVDGKPIPNGWVRPIHVLRSGESFAAGGGYGNFAEGRTVAGFPPFEAGQRRWIEVWGAADRGDEPLPFGAVLLELTDPKTSMVIVSLPPEQVLKGTILEEGVPVYGVVVRARLAYPEDVVPLADSPHLYDFSDARSWHGEGTSDADGRFEVHGLGTGKQWVRIEGPAGLAVTDRKHDVAAPLELDLRAGTTSRAVVTVVDGSGNPLSAARVEVRQAGSPSRGRTFDPRGALVATGTTGADGKLRVWGLDPVWEHQLSVDRPGTGSMGEPFFGRLWKPSDVTVEMWTPRSIRVRVVDGMDRPHEGSQVVVSFDDGTGRTRSGQVGADGACRVDGLPPSTVTVSVFDACSFRAGAERPSKQCPVEQGEVAFVLEKSPEVGLRVKGIHPTILVLATLAEEGGPASGPTQPLRNLRAAWHGVDPAKTYAAYVRTADGSLAAWIGGLRPGAIDAVATPAVTKGVRTSVQWPAGAKSPSVVASRGAMEVSTGIEQADGTWLLKGLPDGEYVVTARCTVPGRTAPASASRTVVAGEDVSIQVR